MMMLVVVVVVVVVVQLPKTLLGSRIVEGWEGVAGGGGGGGGGRDDGIVGILQGWARK